MDSQDLRAAIHSAIDRILDEYLTADSPAPQPPLNQVATVDTPLIIPRGDAGTWTYDWWGGEGTESFYSSQLYDVVTPHKAYRVKLAWSHRASWGKEDRKRAIVFGQPLAATSRVWYPWTEFAETDTGQYAAQIPDPDHPKKILTPTDQLPDRFRDAQVERTDRLFDQIVNGPSLRLVADETDEEVMVAHGYWVARLRGRL